MSLFKVFRQLRGFKEKNTARAEFIPVKLKAEVIWAF